jgi:phosphomevalonate kinase
VTGHDASVRSVRLPDGVFVAVFWSGASARTSDLVARVNALRARDARAYRELHPVAARAAASVDAGDARGFVCAAQDYGRALDALGRAADAPIVPPSFAELAAVADGEHGAFLPSGAGGGDVAVWISTARPSASFTARAQALAMRLLDLALDSDGVRLQSH